MKHALAVALLLATTTVSAEVTSKYDRFKDQTEVSASKGPWSTQNGTLNLNWGLRYQGEAMKTKPGNLQFVIGVINKSWEYLRCHDVAFLADGKPVAVESSKHIGNVQRGFVLETILSILKPDAVSVLAKAQKVEMQLCRTEYTFDEGDMKVLIEFDRAANMPR